MDKKDIESKKKIKKHCGGWIYYADGPNSENAAYYCSKCGEKAINKILTPYCPWCGNKCE